MNFAFRIIVLAAISSLGNSIRNVKVTIPSVVIVGDVINLQCHFDLEGDSLYSVKWYKDKVEFFRFVPSATPVKITFSMTGVDVNLEKSSQNTVVLKRAELETEGVYKCEVSADYPSFQTLFAEKLLTVFVLPKHGPEITGTKSTYKIGDLVNVTCHAGPSKPPAILMWFINGDPISLDQERLYPVVKTGEGLFYTSIGMTFKVERYHFQYGVMKMKCTVTISQEYSLSSEEIVSGSIDKSFHNSSGADGGPTIIDGHPKYNIGDTLNATCIYHRLSPPAAQLEWFVNDEKASSKQTTEYSATRTDGNYISMLGLRFIVRPTHFIGNELKIKCVARLTSPNSKTSLLLGSVQQVSLLSNWPETGGYSSSGCLVKGTTYLSDLSVLLFVASTCAVFKMHLGIYH